MARARVLVAGLGDSGLLTAIHLARHRDIDVVGVSSKPGLVSGQELGMRLARPEEWARDYRVGFERFRRLDGVRTIHGQLTGLDLAAREVAVTTYGGSELAEHWDLLVIATGVTNGFWRRPELQSADEVAAGLRGDHDRLARARAILVVGGGAAAVSSALQLALRWPDKDVHLAHPGDRVLTRHHPRTGLHARRRLEEAGVSLLPGHRAVVPTGLAGERIGHGTVVWQDGAPSTSADAVLWAIGNVRPNTGWLPGTLLDDHGFVRVESTLQVHGHSGVFAIGDVAATDPLRSSARNRADKLLARNIRAHLASRALASYAAPRNRWGSVLGVEPDGLRVFASSGHPFRFPRWAVDSILQPWLVRRGIYRGVRRLPE